MELVIFFGTCFAVYYAAKSYINYVENKKHFPLIQNIFYDICSVNEKIEKLAYSSQYIRKSQCNSLINEAKQVLNATQDNIWIRMASQQQKDSLKVIDYFLSNHETVIREINGKIVKNELLAHANLFDTIEKNPLTFDQRKACVVNEDNNFVLAGAGTGKTSTMIGRAGYLIASKQANPEAILMLAYGRKAADEMQERQRTRIEKLIGCESPKIKTFHALGLEIVGFVERRKPSLSKMAEDEKLFKIFVQKKVDILCEQKEYKKLLIKYIGTEKFPYRSHFDFKNIQDYSEYVRTNELRTLKGEKVKSFEECIIANILTLHGVVYEYEKNYEVQTFDQDYRQYQPDFYLPEYKIYIEHFALDKNSNPPDYFDKKRYLDGVDWKRSQHVKYKTILLETYSYLKREGLLESYLLNMLKHAGVKLHLRSSQNILDDLRNGSEISNFSELTSKFIPLFKESEKDFIELGEILSNNIDKTRLELLLKLIKPVFDAYQIELKQTNTIDFSDMISNAARHVNSKKYLHHYRHILIDEFQDISESRAKLVKALISQNVDTILFAVGDDWQSIYRFTGSDINYTTDFAVQFGATATTLLGKTFRFNDQIGKLSSNFVLKNNKQIKKVIDSNLKINHAAVSLVRMVDTKKGIETSLCAIDKLNKPDSKNSQNVFVLARYNHTLSEFKNKTYCSYLKNAYKSLNIDFMTVHSAKGKEADYVIIVGLDRNKYGFPCEMPNDAIIDMLLPKSDNFLHAEERRLFYVAITRARHRVYIVYNPCQASSFVQELRSDKISYNVCLDEFEDDLLSEDIPIIPCPACKTGQIVPRSGIYGKFASCNNYPYCNHKGQLCPICDNLLRVNENFLECTAAKCNNFLPLCSKCGAVMHKRNGPYGVFYGCSNFNTNRNVYCTNTIKIHSVDI